MSTTDEQQLLPCERWITERDLALRQTHGETRMRAEFNDHYGTIESTADANRAFFEFEAGWQRALAAASEPAAPVDARDALIGEINNLAYHGTMYLSERESGNVRLCFADIISKIESHRDSIARQAAAGEKT